MGIDTALVSRRQLLTAASMAGATGLLAGTSPTALAKAPPRGTQAAAFYRFKIGDIEGTVVSDGPMAVGDPTKVFVGRPDEVRRLMTDHFLPADSLVLDQNALVINTGDKLVLFETGMESVKRNDQMGRLTQSLRAAGIDPKDIDHVVPTHAHIDHIGGIFGADGSHNFPNAQIHISQLDLEYWTDDKRIGTPAEGSARAAQKNLLPNRDRIVFYKDGTEVVAGVRAMDTPGHTVGHTSFMITSGRETLFLAGDIVHHFVAIEKPQIEDAFDTDRKLAIETRIKTMAMLSDQKLRTLVYHMPWPGIGHFTTAGDGFHFEPEPIQVVL